MLGYIIYDKKDNKIIAIEHSKNAKDKYNSDIFGFTWWDTDVSGGFPSMEDVFIETRSYVDIRSAGYKLEADDLYLACSGQNEDGDDEPYKKWKDKRLEIKGLIPKT